MIDDTTGVPSDEVPEADWAEQQVGAEPEGDGAPTVRLPHSSTTEANTADVADQDLEVVLDEED